MQPTTYAYQTLGKLHVSARPRCNHRGVLSVPNVAPSKMVRCLKRGLKKIHTLARMSKRQLKEDGLEVTKRNVAF